MNSEDIIKKIGENSELAAALKDALSRNATMDEISSLVTGFGFDAQDIEGVVTEYQQIRGGSIAEQELDDDELEKVAGGGTGNDCSSTDDCDKNFKYPLRAEAKRCDTGYFCDEYYKCDNDWSCTTTS